MGPWATSSSYFSFSRLRRGGYSGVATFCSSSWTPTHAEEGLGGTLAPEAEDGKAHGHSVGGRHPAIKQEFSQQELKDLDAEGRAILTKHSVKVRG